MHPEMRDGLDLPRSTCRLFVFSLTSRLLRGGRSSKLSEVLLILDPVAVALAALRTAFLRPAEPAARDRGHLAKVGDMAAAVLE